MTLFRDGDLKMDLIFKVNFFDGRAVVENGGDIIRRIYKDFNRLIKKLPVLEKNGITLDSTDWHTSPTINFLRKDGWVFSFEESCYREGELLLIAFCQDKKGDILYDTRKYLTEKYDWQNFPKSGSPPDAATIPIN